jgi:hypothetical protein
MIVDVADPLGGFTRRAGSEIQRYLRAGADQFAKTQKFVGSESVVFGNAPRDVHHAGPFLTPTNAIPPVICGGKISAEPDDWRSHGFGHGDHVRIHVIHVVVGKQ